MADGNTSAGGTQAADSLTVRMGDGASVLGGTNRDDLMFAEPQSYAANLVSMNGSGVSGQARVSVEGDSLRVRVDASGLEANQPHSMHLHGLVGTGHAPFDSLSPTSTLDADRDNFLEKAEVERGVGPALLDLGTAQAGADGSIHTEQSFSLDALDLAQGATAADLFPLDFRSIQIHGMSTGAGMGAGTAGEVDGSDGYKAVLPVASADLTFQPLQTFAAQDAEGVFMVGGNGDDRMIGGGADDMLNGLNGDDVLAGGAGSDDLVGGRGADHFVVGEGKDVVVDFNPAEGDRLVFSLADRQPALVLHDTPQGTWIIAGSGLPTDPGSEGVLLMTIHGGLADASGWFA